MNQTTQTESFKMHPDDGLSIQKTYVKVSEFLKFRKVQHRVTISTSCDCFWQSLECSQERGLY